MKEKLILIINKEVKKYEKLLEKEEQETLEPLIEIQKRLEEIINDPLNIANVNIETLNESIKCLNLETIRKIKLYQKLTSSVSFPLLDEQKQEIREIIKTMKTKLNDIIEMIKRNSNSQQKEIKENLEKNIKLKEKIKNNQSIDSKDIDMIVNLIDNDNIELDDRMDLIIELTLKSIEELNISNELEEEKIVEVEETNLDLDTVIKLFSTYGINFNEFSNKEQSKIIKYGNLERMKNILKLFRDKHIYLNIQEKSGQIQEILIHSSAETITEVIKRIISDTKNEENGYVTDLNKIMQSYFSNPSIFILGKRSYKTSNKGPGPGGNGKADVIGGYQNYIDNRETFKEIGIDLKEPSTSTITMLTFSNRKIKENIANYDFYGIPKNSYANTISCLKAPDSLSTMDQYIECGFHNYMLNNLSMINRRYDDMMFYRIIKSLQLGLSHHDLYHNKDKPTLLGEITNPYSTKFGITDENKIAVVNQYIPKFSQKYDEIIDNSKNGIQLSLVYQDEKIKKLEIFKEDELRYNFNGVIISRLKVLRLYETLLKASFAETTTSIKYVVTKNSILTEDEYRNIMLCLDKIYDNSKGVNPR